MSGLRDPTHLLPNLACIDSTPTPPAHTNFQAQQAVVTELLNWHALSIMARKNKEKTNDARVPAIRSCKSFQLVYQLSSHFNTQPSSQFEKSNKAELSVLLLASHSCGEVHLHLVFLKSHGCCHI